MGLFSKNTHKVAPTSTEEGLPRTKKNNYFISDTSTTLYLCMPVKVDFLIDKMLLNLTIAMGYEQNAISNNEQGIESTQEKITLELTSLLTNPANSLEYTDAKQQLKPLQKTLARLTREKKYLQDNAESFIPIDNYYTSEAKALLGALEKYPERDISLIKITIPTEELNTGKVGKIKVTRPDLLSFTESVKSIPQVDIKKLIAARDAINQESISETAKSKKLTETSLKISDDVITNAKEYKKSIIMMRDPSMERNRSSSSPKIKLLPTIHEKQYFKVIRVSSQFSIAFEEVKPKQDLTLPEAVANKSSSRKR